jgi:hypothetical protein
VTGSVLRIAVADADRKPSSASPEGRSSKAVAQS